MANELPPLGGNPQSLDDMYRMFLKFRKQLLQLLTSSGVDHGSLSGLTDDDHPQYGGSNGVVSGCTISDGGSGTMDISSGVVNLRTTDSSFGVLAQLSYAGQTGQALTDEQTNYVYVQYNGGTPTIHINTTPTLAYDHTIIGAVYRSGSTLHITELYPPAYNGARNSAAYNVFIDGLSRQSGLVLSETGTRSIALTAGILWLGHLRTTISAIDTNVSDTFTYYYRDGGGGHTAVASSTQIDNTRYDDGSGTLATLAGGRYGVHWVYKGIDGDTYVVYGTGSYTLAQAEAAQPPSDLPGHFDNGWHVLLCGKIIIRNGEAAFTLTESAFSATFAGTTVTDHGDLAGLSDDDHAQYALLAGRSGGQTLQGSTASGEDLTLESTAHATKGMITNVDPIELTEQSAPPSVPTGAVRLYAIDANPSSGQLLVYVDEQSSGRYFKIGDIRVVKPTDETKNSDTTLADDADLVVSVEANEKWYCEWHFAVTTNATPDFKFTISGPSTPTNVMLSWQIWENGTNTLVTADHTAGSSYPGTVAVTAATDFIVKVTGVIENGSNSGTIALQWAQNTSDAANTTVQRGSSFIAKRIEDV